MCNPNGLIENSGRSVCVSQTACNSSNRMTAFLCRFTRQVSLDAMDADAHVGFAHPECVGHFLVAKAFEQQQSQRPIDLVQLCDLLVEPVESRIYYADRVERPRGDLEEVGSFAPTDLLGAPGD